MYTFVMVDCVADQCEGLDWYVGLCVGGVCIRNSRAILCESDDVIWLRNHAYTWILVPNIGCKQTMASNTGGPLNYFFGVHTFCF